MQEFDYIVVGAGAAGCVLAARLAENPDVTVLLLELGPNNYGNPWLETLEKPADLLWEHPLGPRPSPSSLTFDTVPQTERKYRYPRGNGLGGSINHHSCLDGRGSAAIYDKIAEVVQDEVWSYDSVLPYFKKMETHYGDPEFHGKDGWLHVMQFENQSPFNAAFVAAAHRVLDAPVQNDMSGNPENVAGVGGVDLQVKEENGVLYRSSAYADLLIPVMEKHHNVKILFNSLVTKVLFKQKTAVGVQVQHQPHAYAVDRADNVPYAEKEMRAYYCNREVILCGGAINTPQILLLSGLGPHAHLTAHQIPVLVDLPGVGSHLLDHHECGINFEIDNTRLIWGWQAKELLAAGAKGKLLEKFATEHSDPGNILDWYSGVESDIGHDLHIHADQKFFFDFDFLSNEPLPDGKLRSDYIKAQMDINDPKVYQLFLLEVLKVSKSQGTIRLASSDPTAAPLIDLALDEDDEACERMAHGILMLRQLVQDSKLKQFYQLEKGVPRELFPGAQYGTLEELKFYLKRWSAYGHHISGTACMGSKGDPEAVLDSHCRVRGVKNLRVCDCSIYPGYLHGYNTSRGAYLIGEMVADFIKGVL